ncbi:MAG: hypothetical protein H0V12_01855 [Chloroflexi bacterium]|nr:hypothetical protein [Chloroflexota bacterium]
MIGEMDGSARIAWAADGYETIRVLAPRRSQSELADFARSVADAALFNRSVGTLRTALREELGAVFDLRGDDARAHRTSTDLIVTIHPPPADPNPDA